MRTKLGVRIISGLMCAVMVFADGGIITFASNVPEDDKIEAMQETEEETTEASTDADSVIETEEGSATEEEPAAGEGSVAEEEPGAEEETTNEEEKTSESQEGEGLEDNSSEDTEDEETVNDIVSKNEYSEQNTSEGTVLPYSDATYELTYEIDRNGWARITGYTGKPSGDLIIPGYIDGYGVHVIDIDAFKGCSGFTGKLEIPNTVYYIMNSAFEGCSGLSGELMIPDSVHSLSSKAFKDCSGFTGDLIIPDSVGTGAIKEGIDESTFEGCSGFNGKLVISKNASYIDRYAFKGCSGLTGDLVIPDSVEEIKWGAFEGCEGLNGNVTISNGVIGSRSFYNCTNFKGNLILSDGVTKIEDSAFEGCSGFTGDLVIPGSVQTIGWSAFSECIGFNGKLVIENGVQTIDGSAFYGCSGFTGDLVIPGSVQTIGWGAFYKCTGFNGKLVIENGVQVVDDCAFAWCESIEDVYLPASVETIGDDAFEDLDIIMHCVKDSYAWNWAREKGFEVVEWNGKTVSNKYAPKDFLVFVMDEDTGLPLSGVKVLVDNICYETSDDGSVTFTRTGNICKKVIFSKEKYETKTVDLELRPDTCELITLKANDEIRINIPSINTDVRVKESITILGKKINWMDFKFDVDLPFGNSGRDGINSSIPLNIEFDKEKKTAKVTFGIKETDENGDVNTGTYNAMKALCDKPINSKTGKEVEKFLKKHGHEGAAGELGVKVETSVLGYFEYDLENGKILDSGALVGVKGSGSFTHRPVWGGGVVYIKTTLTISAEGKLVLSFEDDEVKFLAEIQLKEALKVAGGIGDKNVHLEVGAEGYFTQKINFSPRFELGLGANVYVEAQLFLLKGTLNHKIAETTLFTWEPNAKSTTATDLYSSSSEENAAFDLSMMEMMDRTYLTSAGTCVNLTSSDGTVSRNISQENAYPEGDPQICALSDGSLLAVWITDNGAKSDANRTTLVYSIYKNNVWSSPQAVCETGRGDFYPSLTAVGNKAFLSWTNMDKEFTNDVSTEDMISSTDICFAEYENGSFGAPVYITESGNSILELDAVVAADSQTQVVVWIENSENDPFYETGTTSIWARRCERGSWQNAECLIENLAAVTSIDAEYANGRLFVAYTQDLDGNISTTGDSEVFLYSNGENKRVTSDSKADRCVSFDHNALYWSSEGEIMYVNTDSLHIPSSTGIVGAEYFSVLNNGNNKALVFLVENGFKSELYVAKEENGSYTQPVPLTARGGHISDYALIYCADGSYSGILYETEVFDNWESSPYGNTALSTYGKVEAMNLSLDNAYIDETLIYPGAVIPIELELYNESTQNLTRVNVTLQSGGTVVAERVLSCDIKAGETGTVSLDYQLGSNLQTQKLLITASPIDYTDSNVADNSITASLALGDVALTNAFIDTTGEETIISGKVVNQGYGDVSDVVFKVLEGSADGEELYSVDFGTIAAGGEEAFSYVIPQRYLDYTTENDGKYFYISCESGSEESQYANNSDIVVAFPKNVTGIELSAETLEIPVKSQAKLVASIEPFDAVNQKVYFTTDDSTVAVVSEDGTIIATGIGTAIITAISADGGYAASCTVTVVESDTALYHLEKGETTLEKGDSEKILLLDTDNVEPSEDIMSTLTWTSSDKTVATVASDGTVTAVSAGTAKITVNIGEKFYDSCIVTVTDAEIQAIAILPGTVEMLEGDSIVLDALFMPENTETDNTLQWTSEDETIATVTSDGTVSAVAEGKTKITATSENGRGAWCEVTVNALPRYIITFDSDTGEEVKTVENVLYGNTVSLPVEPIRNGYHFMGWYTEPNGQGVCFTENSVVTETMTVYAYWVFGEQYEEYTVENIPDQIYTGTIIKPGVVVMDGGTILRQGRDYTVTYRNNIKVGTGQVIIKGKGNYTKTMTVAFNIVPKSIEDSDITISCADKVYNGKKQISNPVVKWGKKTLKKGTDYQFTFSEDQISPGTVTVIIEGINNYKGSVTTFYRISANSISKAIVDKVPTQTYTGEAVKPMLVVRPKKGAEPLVLGVDYEVIYENNTASGKAKAIIKGIGSYGGTKTVTFNIGKRELSSENISVSIDKNTFVYTGSAIKPIVTVIDEGTLLREGTDYTLSYKDNVNVAEINAKKAPTVIIKGKGNYTGNIINKFSITPRLLAGEGVVVTVSDAPYTGKLVKPTVIIKDGKVTLKNGKDYTISYENCTNVAKADSALPPTVTITGINNYSGVVTKTFSIYKKGLKSITDEKVKIAFVSGVPVYTGNAIKPEVTVKDGSEVLVEGVDYTVSYKNNKEAKDKDAKNAPSITIKGKGEYSGSRTEKFTILTKEIVAQSEFSITVEDVKYTKKALKPAVTVMDGNKKLKNGKDYVLSYSNNINIAEKNDIIAPTVTITGKGNYSGSIQESFRIYESSISSVYVQKIGNEMYTGKGVTPIVVVKPSSKSTELLVEGKDYVVTYDDNIKIGKAKVTITGKGQYGGIKKVTFLILPKWLKWFT